MNRLIVIGNGFDIACGLNSSYESFFKYRMRQFRYIKNEKCYQQERQQLRIEILEAISEFNNAKDLDVITFIQKKIMNTDITFWDICCLFAEECIDEGSDVQWQDVESMIAEVISILLAPNGIYQSRVKYIESDNFNGKEKFKNIVKNVSVSGTGSKIEIATKLLTELKKFERIFATFISNQINVRDDNKLETNKYFNRVGGYLKVLAGISKLNEVNWGNLDVINVFSFNYSLNTYQAFNFKLEAEYGKFHNDDSKSARVIWRNIHGISQYDSEGLMSELGTHDLPAPIFGVDDQIVDDKSGEFDLRRLFTKGYRRQLEGVDGFYHDKPNYTNLESINIYGHSLGEADYSYFFLFFDECNLINSDTKITYYYYPADKSGEQTAQIGFEKLFMAYENSRKLRNDGSLFEKLKKEHRLILVPSNSIKPLDLEIAAKLPEN